VLCIYSEVLVYGITNGYIFYENGLAEGLYLLVIGAGGKVFGLKLQGSLILFRYFHKIAKVTISFVMSVHPSVRVDQFGFHWTDFHEI
jgi:hypothetical protein